MITGPERDTPGSLRARKKQESHRALRLAALELVAERGLSEVRVEDIAHRAGVSPRTFFNYFASKEQALVDPTPDHGEGMRDRIRQAPAGTEVRDILLAALIDHAVEISADRTTWRLVKQVTSRHPELLPLAMGSSRETSRTLVEAVAERLGSDPDEDPYPTVLVEASVAAMRAAAAHFLRCHSGPTGAPTLSEDDEVALRTALEDAATLLRDGLPTPVSSPPHPSRATQRGL
ncbi:TetR/AcrR family transcriptional regulator [Raineyella fluvialis]|uniref:TetR family transcriptional regulator n=1 Tax=Raineyella fluvialis TaxID=2662261 RepID=A0A5Q2FEF5_9ACTN|nr:TetR/AcrR family transcriptional regulator [Raineyella fluvialis]QGF23864.1 TetR family transcriptional regulator [Raineyella fluvialis]